MRLLSRLFLLSPLLLAASAPARIQAEPLELALKRARFEQAAAEADTARLEKAAASARTEAERLAAREAAAAQGIEAAEARITAADMQFRLAAANVLANRERLAEEQRPISSLLAGLAVTAERPPIIALLDGRGSDELVKVSILLSSTLPVVRSRTRALSAELIRAQGLERSALLARAELVKSRQDLALRRTQFADLEQRAFDRAVTAGGKALTSGDVAIAAGEQMEELKSEESKNRSARGLAMLLEAEPALPPSPFVPSGPTDKPPIAYALPVNAPVLEGLGAVDDSGVRSRGIRFATERGAQVKAPADGIVRFSGPFRDYDGIIILDHGAGWMTLIVNVSSELKQGDRVHIGDPLGRALGPIEVQLTKEGQRFSPALIAGSSQTLSNNMKGG
jgi:septal ring factor EnvC (AmiA/AmiB activator)